MGSGAQPPGSTQPTEPARRPARRGRWRVALAGALLGLAVLLGGCGGGASAPPAGIEDPAATARVPVPGWYTARFRPPAGSVPVESIDDPDPGFGRTVTWRVPGSFDDTLDAVQRSFRSLGWAPTDRKDTTGSGARRTSFYLENDQVYAVRVFADDTLSGVRLTVELPAAR